MKYNNKLQNILKLFQNLDINHTIFNIFNYFNNQISNYFPICGQQFYKYNYKQDNFKLLINRNEKNENKNDDILYKVIKSKRIYYENNELFLPLIFLDKALGVMYIRTKDSINKQIDLNELKLDIDLCSLIYYNANIYSIAIKDELTRLYNIRFFHYKINEYFDLLKKKSKKISIIMIDIDYFKHFNDKYGHQVGDEILKIIAQKVKKTVSKEGLVARYGGEEFIVLLPYYNSSRAFSMAERIRRNIQDLTIKNDQYFWKITVSLGISTFPDHTENITELIHFADCALYCSKHNGRNLVSIYKKDE